MLGLCKYDNYKCKRRVRFLRVVFNKGPLLKFTKLLIFWLYGIHWAELFYTCTRILILHSRIGVQSSYTTVGKEHEKHG